MTPRDPPPTVDEIREAGFFGWPRCRTPHQSAFLFVGDESNAET